MIPHDAIDRYEQLAGNQDMAGYGKVNTNYWGQIDALIMQLTNVDAGQAAESYRLDFMHALGESGIPIETLRRLKKVVNDAEEKIRRQRIQNPRPWWKL